MTPFVSYWLLWLKAFRTDMKYSAVRQFINLLSSFTYRSCFYSYLFPSTYFRYVRLHYFPLVPFYTVLIYNFTPMSVKVNTFVTFAYLTVNCSLEFRIASFIELNAWEKILNQTQEEWLILINLTSKHKQINRSHCVWMLSILIHKLIVDLLQPDLFFYLHDCNFDSQA